jgi:hypothetical protein
MNNVRYSAIARTNENDSLIALLDEKQVRSCLRHLFAATDGKEYMPRQIHSDLTLQQALQVFSVERMHSHLIARGWPPTPSDPSRWPYLVDLSAHAAGHFLALILRSGFSIKSKLLIAIGVIVT